MIDIDAVQKAYLDKEIFDMGHINGEENQADALTKMKKSDARMKAVNQNKCDFLFNKWVI